MFAKSASTCPSQNSASLAGTRHAPPRSKADLLHTSNQHKVCKVKDGAPLHLVMGDAPLVGAVGSEGLAASRCTSGSLMRAGSWNSIFRGQTSTAKLQLVHPTHKVERPARFPLTSCWRESPEHAWPAPSLSAWQSTRGCPASHFFITSFRPALGPFLLSCFQRGVAAKHAWGIISLRGMGCAGLILSDSAWSVRHAR